MADQERALRILCADADTGRQHAYRNAVAEVPGRKFTLLAAETGGQALSLARTFRPDCVVVADSLADMGCGNDIAAAPGAENDALAAMAEGADDFVQTSGMSGATLLRAVGNAVQITRLRAGLAQARRQVALGGLDDPLTSLPARKLFRDRLTHAVILGKRNNQSVAVMLVELSALREINFMKGHAAGDAALREVACRMTATLRQADTVARTSGNQFGIVLHTGASHEGCIVAARKLLAAIEPPMQQEDGRVDISVDIGIALFPDHGDDGDTLLHHAEAAMAHARRNGGGYTVFAYNGMPARHPKRDASAA